MLGYFLRRLGRAAITIIGISILVFIAARLSGDPTLHMLPEDASAKEVAQLRASLGLDQPYWVQYLRYVGHVLHGDFGTSLRYGEPALPLVLHVVPATLQLALAAFVLAKIAGILLGVTAALYRGTPLDRALRGGAILADSAPPFWIGMMLILFFSIQLHWFPSSSRLSFASMVLPTLAIALGSVAVTLRLTRSSMLETLSADYVKFLRSRGIPRRTIIWKHAMRNAAIPVVAMLGIQLGYLLAGTVIIETVFNWPGVGRLMVEALSGRDFPVIQAGTLFVSVVTVLLNLAVDMLFGVIDPRIRYD